MLSSLSRGFVSRRRGPLSPSLTHLARMAVSQNKDARNSARAGAGAGTCAGARTLATKRQKRVAARGASPAGEARRGENGSPGAGSGNTSSAGGAGERTPAAAAAAADWDSFVSESSERVMTHHEMSRNPAAFSAQHPHHPDLYDPNIHLPSAPTNWAAEGYEPSTPLWESIASLIAVTGQPLSHAEFMRMALTHPLHGYYTTAAMPASSSSSSDFDRDDYDVGDAGDETVDEQQRVFGPSGDFVTAPEVSQIFGETLGVWFYTQRQQFDIGRSSWQWVECGPGRGSLMVDLLRFCFAGGKIRDRFGSGCRHVHLIEASPALRKVQRDALRRDVGDLVRFEFRGVDGDARAEGEEIPSEGVGGSTKESDGLPAVEVHWHESWPAFQIWQAKNNSRLPSFVVCQEFLDALPVYAFEKTEGGWRERLVDVAVREDLMDDEEKERAASAPSSAAEEKGDKKPRLRIVLAPEATPAAKTLLRVDEETGLMPDEDPGARMGDVIEINPEAVLLSQDIARTIEDQGGAALIIDYGQEGSADSIRAFARHRQVHFLSRPGQVDVTADVDFASLRHGVNSLGLPRTRAHGPVGQGQFLMSMGVQERVIQLIESDGTTDEQAEDLYNALVRLASPEQMGERYKVLAITRDKTDGSSSPPPAF